MWKRFEENFFSKWDGYLVLVLLSALNAVDNDAFSWKAACTNTFPPIFLLQPDGTELFHFVAGCSSWAAYLASMMADGTWGDHVILHGAANCFETCIHVISSLPHHHDVLICPEYDLTGSNRLVLGHLKKLHYVSLIPDIGWKDVWLHCNVTFPNLCYQNSNHLNEAAAPFISALFAKVTIKLATKAWTLFCGITAKRVEELAKSWCRK